MSVIKICRSYVGSYESPNDHWSVILICRWSLVWNQSSCHSWSLSNLWIADCQSANRLIVGKSCLSGRSRIRIGESAESPQQLPPTPKSKVVWHACCHVVCHVGRKKLSRVVSSPDSIVGINDFSKYEKSLAILLFRYLWDHHWDVILRR